MSLCFWWLSRAKHSNSIPTCPPGGFLYPGPIIWSRTWLNDRKARIGATAVYTHEIYTLVYIERSVSWPIIQIVRRLAYGPASCPNTKHCETLRILGPSP